MSDEGEKSRPVKEEGFVLNSGLGERVKSRG